MAEYLTSNAAIAYPFTDDARGLRQGAGPIIPMDLFVDAAFEYEPSNAIPQQAYLSSLRRISANTLEIVIYFEDVSHDQVVVVDGVPIRTLIRNTPVTITAIAFDAPYIAAYGQAATTDTPILASVVLLRDAMVSYLAGLTDGQLVQIEVPDYTFRPQPLLPFEQATCCFSTYQVSSFMIWNHGPPDPQDISKVLPEPTGYSNSMYPDGAIPGDVTFFAGYNFKTTLTPDVQPDTSEIMLAAIPGEGLGQVACDPNAGVGVSNAPAGISPQQGNIQLKAGTDACYQLVPLISTQTIQIHGHCQACCTCDDYKAYLDYLAGLCNRVRNLKVTLDHGHAEYETGVLHFNNTIAPKYYTCRLDLFGYRGANWGPDVNRGAPNWFRGVIQVYNQRKHPVVITEMSISINGSVDFSSWTQGTMTDTSPTFPPPNLPQIPSGQKLSLTVLAWMSLAAWNALPEWHCTISCKTQDVVSGEVDNLSANCTVT